MLLQASSKQSSSRSSPDSARSYENFQTFQHEITAILQVGTKTASNQRPFWFQTQLFNRADPADPFLGSQHHAEALVVHCKWMQERNRETQASTTLGAYINHLKSVTPFASSLKGYGYASLGWFRLAGHLSKWKRKDFFAEQAEISRKKMKLGDLPH